MKPRHRLLARQIRRFIGDDALIPPEMGTFMNAVNDAYHQSDTDRAMVERSLELSSRELLQSNAEMRAIFQALPDPYLRIDSTGRILDYKAASKDRFLPDKKLTGSMLSELLSYETWEHLHSQMEKAIRLQTLIALPLPFHFSNQSLSYEVRLAPVFKDQVIMILRDISDRIRAEKEQAKLQHQLLQAQKMEAIGTLAGGVAHDFNNILMALQGYASLAMQSPGNIPLMQSYLESIEGLVGRGAGLTRQLLGFARGGKYELQVLQLNDLLENTAYMFGRTKKEIAIFLNLDQHLWPVEADRGQIEQVMLNLLINAGQAMPGGGDLTIETENIFLNESEASTHGVAPGRYVRISITDTGTGMDEATRQRIFEPFFTTKAVGEGTGLGLASAYGIIQNHRGLIDVISSRGKGSTFQIYLPASQNVIKETNVHPDILLTGQETILIVDDEQINLIVLRELLSRIGYKVLQASSGQEAIAVYMSKKDQISLIILDMIMPGMSGPKVFDAIREMDPAIKVILCSGYSMDHETEAVMSKGCCGFLQKPFSIEALSSKIREALG